MAMSRKLVVEDPHARHLRALRRAFAEHNRLVLLVALLTLLVTAALWYLLFALIYWLALIVSVLIHGLDARPPENLPTFFIYSAGLLVLLTWIAHQRTGREIVKDEKSAFEIATEFLLAVPRATLAVWGNLSAWQRLNETELAQAADLLARIEREGRLALHNVPLELPEPKSRMRILLALQLIEMLHVSRMDGIAWLSLAGRKEIGRRK
jgi:hypothetical protein